MLLRAHALIALAVLSSGCAVQSPDLSLGLARSEPSSAPAAAAAAPGEKTMAAKVLAALALERITGRAPDPARFGELN